MVVPVLMLALSAAPLTLELDAFTSEVEGLSSERLTEAMRGALAQAVKGDGALVPRNGAVKVSGRFTAGGTKRYRLLVAVTRGDEPSLLAFDFNAASLSEAGARAVAAAVVQRARALPEPLPANAARPAAPPRAQRSDASAEPSVEVDDDAPAPEPELAPNVIYAEGLGTGLFYSLNYERVLFGRFAARVGVSYLAFGASAGASSASAFQLAVPVGLSWIGARSGRHALETGAGATIRYAGGSAFVSGAGGQAAAVLPMGWLQLGYRYHPVGGAGFHFRVGVMALLGAGLGLGVRLGNEPQSLWLQPWGYLSLGAAF
jgi:hypothetical protein